MAETTPLSAGTASAVDPLSGEEPDWSGLVQQRRVHRRAYTDPSIFELEMSRVFGGVWVYLLHESEIPLPNDFKTGHIGRRPIIVTRDRHGDIHVLLNRCMHRAATVCREERGRSRSFTCPYHGWTYSNTGDLTGVPWPKAYGETFDRAAFGLRRVPRVEGYRGFVFATLNPDMPPLATHLGRARELLDEWIDRAPGVQVVARSGAHRMLYRGNWKLTFDNGADGYHPAYSHRSLLTLAQRLDEGKDMQYFAQSPDEGPMYQCYLGNGHTFLDQRPVYEGTGSFWRQQRPQPGREAYEELVRVRYGGDAQRLLDLAVGSQMNLCIFPNLLIIGSQIQVIEPIAVDRTLLTWYATTLEGVPEEVNVLRMRTQEDFPSFGEPDDMANFEECQRGMAIPEIEWVDISRGLDVDGRVKVDEDDVVSGPVTDELQLRGYWGYWRRIMSSRPRLVAVE